MSKWIKLKDWKPDLNKKVLVAAKKGRYWPVVDGSKDQRDIEIYVGYFYDENEDFKKLKTKIEFEVDCVCSGTEIDKENLEVTHWMPLPQPPKEECS